jgi:flagellin
MPSIMVENMLNNTNNSLNNDLTQLSSGLRINSAADDPAGYAIGNAFKAAIASMNVASQNASQAQSMLQTADGAFSQINNIMVQMKSLATEAASGQESSTNLSSLNNEFQDLASEINQIANSTVYGGTTLLANSSGSVLVTFQVGNVNSSNDQFLVTISSATTTDLGLSGASLTSIGFAQAAMDSLDSALTSINTMMGNIGGYQNQLTYLTSNLTTSIQNYTSSESTIMDVDMASAVSDMTKQQILEQSAMSMLAQANQDPQQILKLLQG